MRGPTSKGGRLIEVSHTVEAGLVTYPGLPPPSISDHMTWEESRAHYAEGTEFCIRRIAMVSNTGTYVDAPFHRFRQGKDLSEVPLESVANLEGVTVRAKGLRSIDASRLAGLELRGKAILFHTGWDVHWGSDRYFDGHPYLTQETAERMAAAGARLVGIDSLNIDSTGDPSRPVHTILLGAGIPIVEHLCNLEALPDAGFRFFAVPVKVRGFPSFPVRAFAVLDDDSVGS